MLSLLSRSPIGGEDPEWKNGALPGPLDQPSTTSPAERRGPGHCFSCDPVDYFPRRCTELLSMFLPSAGREERVSAGSLRTPTKYKTATIIIMIITPVSPFYIGKSYELNYVKTSVGLL